MLVTVFNKNANRYELMTKVAAIPHLRQPAGLQQLHDSADTFRDPLQLTGEELARDIGGTFVLAANKTLSSLQRKSGLHATEGEDITDYVRGSVMIGHWKQVEALRKHTQPDPGSGSPIIIAGNQLVCYMDNFAVPLENGMRRMMQKYDVANDNDDHQICEIQGRVAAMKEAEDLTHRIYRMKREFTRLANEVSASDHKLSYRLNMLAMHCQDLIKPIHDLEAMRHGYDVLITEPYDRATAPSPNNPILKILMREKDAAAQLQPILKMASDPKMTAKTYVFG